jgi:hypothetical protein
LSWFDNLHHFSFAAEQKKRRNIGDASSSSKSRPNVKEPAKHKKILAAYIINMGPPCFQAPPRKGLAYSVVLFICVWSCEAMSGKRSVSPGATRSSSRRTRHELYEDDAQTMPPLTPKRTWPSSMKELVAMGDGLKPFLKEHAMMGAKCVGAKDPLLVIDWNDAAIGMFCSSCVVLDPGLQSCWLNLNASL